MWELDGRLSHQYDEQCTAKWNEDKRKWKMKQIE